MDFGYYLITSLLPKAGMMIVIVEKLLNVSNGFKMVGAAKVGAVRNALSLVNRAKNKFNRSNSFLLRISTYVYTWYWLYIFGFIFRFGLSKRTHIHTHVLQNSATIYIWTK